ncbi:MAG: 8-oxoguanine deaminase, partial [Rhodobacteraceae bacterium]|nr:8-oxoguanine deaminase [Paracoccaceae bacterium]
MRKILIRNAHTILTMDDARRELTGCDILIEDGVISQVGPGLDASGAEIIDAAGALVTP